jgi:AcrR family transcriptional regulator
VEAATAAISEGGVPALRVREITDRADVGRGSFYYHFASTDELVDAVANATLENLAANLVGTVPADADPAVVAGVAAAKTVLLAVNDPELARLIVNLDHTNNVFMDTIAPHARELLARGVEIGRFHLADVEMSAITITGGGLAVIRAILRGTAPDDPATKHSETVLRAVGIAPEEAKVLSRLRTVA